MKTKLIRNGKHYFLLQKILTPISAKIIFNFGELDLGPSMSVWTVEITVQRICSIEWVKNKKKTLKFTVDFLIK